MGDLEQGRQLAGALLDPLLQRLRYLVALRYILGEGDDMEGAVRRIPRTRDIVLYPELRAVFADIPLLDDEARDVIREHPLCLSQVLVQIIRVSDRRNVSRVQLLPCVARDLIVRRISLEEAPLWVCNDHADRGMREYRIEPLLGRAQLALLAARILRLLPLRDITDDAAVEGPTSYPPGGEAQLDRKLRPVSPQPVDLDRLTGRPLVVCGAHPLQTALVGIPIALGHQYG